MKKVLKIVALIILLGGIGFEGWYIFVKDKKKEEPIASPFEETINEDDKKYVADTTTKYKENSLTYKMETEGIYNYVQIDGLKDKEVQAKINKAIKEKTMSFDKSNLQQIDYGEGGMATYTKIIATVYSSFANTISIRIGLSVTDDVRYNENPWGILDAINFDLNTGNELNINDVLLSTNILKSQLVTEAYEDIYRRIGIICSGGPCNNPYPHYERVDDGVMSVVNQFNSGTYSFAFDNTGVILYFLNSYINTPYFISFGTDERLPKKDYEGCNEYEEGEDGDKVYIYICNDYYAKEYIIRFPYGDYLSNVIIFDKFASEESLFTNDTKEELYKFMSSTEESSLIYEDGNNLYDFALYKNDLEYGLKEFKMTKDLVIKESKELETKGGKNIWRFTRGTLGLNPNYQYYIVYHYEVPESKYEEVKKQIFDYRVKYLDDYDKPVEYDFLKDYKTKDAYYFYVMTDKGKETNVRSMFNPNYDWASVIPEKWLSKGKYKTVKDLVNSAYVICDHKYKFEDRLVIYVETVYSEDFYDYSIKLAYKGEEIDITHLGKDEQWGYNIFEY